MNSLFRNNYLNFFKIEKDFISTFDRLIEIYIKISTVIFFIFKVEEIKNSIKKHLVKKNSLLINDDKMIKK